MPTSKTNALFFDGSNNLEGPLNLASAQSGQIVFPAAQHASTGANVLDDYQEDDWSPTVVSSGGGSCTYSLQYGKSTKVGRLVTVEGIVIINVDSLSAGNLSIGGLIHAVSGTTGAVTGAMYISGVVINVAGGYYNVIGYFQGGGTTINLYEVGNNNAPARLTDADVANGSVFSFSASYHV